MTSIISLSDAFNDPKLLSQITQGDVIAWHSEQGALGASLVRAHIIVEQCRAQLSEQQIETSRLEQIIVKDTLKILHLESTLREDES